MCKSRDKRRTRFSTRKRAGSRRFCDYCSCADCRRPRADGDQEDHYRCSDGSYVCYECLGKPCAGPSPAAKKMRGTPDEYCSKHVTFKTPEGNTYVCCPHRPRLRDPREFDRKMRQYRGTAGNFGYTSHAVNAGFAIDDELFNRPPEYVEWLDIELMVRQVRVTLGVTGSQEKVA